MRWLEQANVSGPKQVEIESKFVEITQNNLKELGFDWLLGQFNIGNHKVFRRRRHIGHFPPRPILWTSHLSRPGGVPVGQFPVTGGNRSGNLAISGERD